MGDKIAFLHKILPGKSDRSYGIQVAKLAGLPRKVVERAEEILATLETSKGDTNRRALLQNIENQRGKNTVRNRILRQKPCRPRKTPAVGSLF